MTPEQRLASFHIRSQDGRVTSAGDAVIDLAERVPLLRPVASAGRRVPLLAAAVDAGYKLAAANRHRLARFVSDRPPVSRWRGEN